MKSEKNEVAAVIREPLTGSNCYVLESEQKNVVIDPGSFDTAERLKEMGADPEWVFLTHEHCDHMAGLSGIRSFFPNAKVLATKACSCNLGNKRKNMSAIMGVYLYYRNGREPAEKYPVIDGGAADVVFDKNMVLDWRGLRFEFVCLPGHTEGSCGIMLNGKTFFSGDYLLPGEEVLTRFPGGDEESYRQETLPYLDSLPKGIRVYPGHGDDFRT